MLKGREKMYKPQIKTFYREEQVPAERIGFSRSPQKPKLLLEKINKNEILSKKFKIYDFQPFEIDEFKIIHEYKYVDDFFNGIQPLADSNGLNWNAEFANSVRFTNASLYNAQREAILNPNIITFSPTSGFHHAKPRAGWGFCTFAGQVISAIKIYEEFRYKTIWIDLDGHYGNSIEDCRKVNEDLNEIIPLDCNINPSGLGTKYLNSLKEKLNGVKNRLITENNWSVCFAQGADSHEWDQLGGQVTTDEWIEAHKIIYSFIKEVNEQRETKLPLTLSLFGGYRDDDYNSVLNLHISNLVSCLNILCNRKIKYYPKVLRPSLR
jgi:acetoin utilization deacetylase AcuC-like enzyme